MKYLGFYERMTANKWAVLKSGRIDPGNKNEKQVIY